MRRSLQIGAAALALLLSTFAFGVTKGEKLEFEGWIVSRQGESLRVYTVAQEEVHVVVTPYTKLQEPRGRFKIRKTPRSVSDLLPGLKIKVRGIGSTASQVIAESIRFSNKDLETAYALKAGVIPVQTEVAANTLQIAVQQADIRTNQQQIATHERRFSELAEYTVKSTATVYFPPGGSTLSPEGQEILSRLAGEAQRIDGYFLQVRGHTDSSGPVERNQALSMRRAQAAIAFLENNGQIPLTRILTPAALSDSRPASSNATPGGRLENRRVEVTILVNQGVAGEPMVATTK